MKKLIYMLQNKWGCFEKDKYYLKQNDTSNGKKKSYLNVLFNPISSIKYQFAKKYFACEFHPSLLDFYEQYNGLMLFSESLRIYGVDIDSDALYISYDIVSQNIKKDIKRYGNEFDELVVFGHYSSCLFCFDKTNFDFLYVFDTKQKKIVYKFKNLVELLTHYVDYLINEYDETGKKIHFDKSLEGLPIANVSLEFI